MTEDMNSQPETPQNQPATPPAQPATPQAKPVISQNRPVSKAQEVITNAPIQPVMVKSKTVAVVLAVFLSFWTWLYTYKTDAWKFWLNLVLSILTAGIWAVVVSWIWAIIDTAIKPHDWYDTYPNGDLLKKQADVEKTQMIQQSIDNQNHRQDA